jgi:hypothetical protein
MFPEWAGLGPSSFFEAKKLEQKNFNDMLFGGNFCPE